MSDESANAAPMGASGGFRGSVLHFLGDPGDQLDSDMIEFFEDGLLVVADGHVQELGDANSLLSRLPADMKVTDYSGRLMVPGFIDTHIHYAQTDMIAAHGEQLLEWLERYAFPTERQFADSEHAQEVAAFFVEELLRNGTTTALVFATVHKNSVDAIFRASQTRGMRMLAGKVLMDRNCPEFLQDTAESGYSDSKELIGRWHNKGRLHYAVTPRFAPTSTEEQLAMAGRLLEEHPGVYLQSHVAENRGEVAWVTEVYPWSRSYLDVYDRFGLLRPRAVYAHCLHLDDVDRRRMAETGTAMSFCPTSNLFLGSGLFDAPAARAAGVRVGVGTDVGAGTSFSILRTLHEAYKVAQLAGHTLSAFRAFYLGTLGSAESLYLDDRIGNFAVGKDADFVVLDFAATRLMERRLSRTESLAEKLFVLMMLGDERAVAATHILGRPEYVRQSMPTN